MDKKKNSEEVVYLFKVTVLSYIEEDDDIWRIIAIRPNQILASFHKIIFKAFDRFDEHMWSFFSGKPRAKDTIEYAVEVWDTMGPRRSVYSAKRAKVGDLDWSKRKKYYYLFDYGDDWWHEIKFIGEAEVEPNKRYPLIVEKHGESPPQYPDEEDYEDEEDIE